MGAIKAGETVGLNDEMQIVVLRFMKKSGASTNVNWAEEQLFLHVPCIPKLPEVTLHTPNVSVVSGELKAPFVGQCDNAVNLVCGQ